MHELEAILHQIAIYAGMPAGVSCFRVANKVFAELDEDRAERVVRLLDEGRSGQVLLTAPKPADVELRGGRLARWRIREGVVFTDG